jgi:hypothetical protein
MRLYCPHEAGHCFRLGDRQPLKISDSYAVFVFLMTLRKGVKKTKYCLTSDFHSIVDEDHSLAVYDAASVV